MKKIIIDGKEYTMKSSAYTQFAYQNETGRNFLDDLEKLSQRKKDNVKMSDYMPIISIILDIAYVMIEEANPDQVANKIEFYKGIEHLDDGTKWIDEVFELAISPISGQPKKHQN